LPQNDEERPQKLNVSDTRTVGRNVRNGLLICPMRSTPSFHLSSGLNSNKGTKCDMGFGVIPFIDWVFGLRRTPKIAPRFLSSFGDCAEQMSAQPGHVWCPWSRCQAVWGKCDAELFVRKGRRKQRGVPQLAPLGGQPYHDLHRRYIIHENRL
jgi:hypothetical protein